MNLEAINVQRKTGNEKFHSRGTTHRFSLLDFWQWSSSDLLSNALRGVLAEFLVAEALGISGGVRTEWDAVDLVARSGIEVEVKSASYLQSWTQSDFSAISFGVQPTVGWYSDTNTYSEYRKRQADVYVFCLLAHKDKATVDPMDLEQWRFFVISTARMNAELGDQKTLSLSKLLQLSPIEARSDGLANAIEQAYSQGMQ